MNTLPETLPQGYSFASTFSPQEVLDLRASSDWGTEHSTDVWQKVIDLSIASVGVRNESETLVGVGFLAGNPRHAVLCDFVVHPVHRGRGLGRAILHRRLNIADAADIPYLYTDLAPTNRLRSYYERLGFISTGHEYTRAARRHPAELEEMAGQGN
jgi:GNAT superfamily N-acetyltransferase